MYQNRRWDGDFQTVQRVLQAGTLGELVYFESHFDRYRPEVRDLWREQAGPGSGLWYDLGPHLADQALQLFGPPAAVYAEMALQRDNAQTSDYFHVLLRYPRLRVVLHASMLVVGGNPRFVLHGTQGSFIKYGLDTQEDVLRQGLRPGVPGWGYDPLEGQLYLPGKAPQPIPTQPGDYRHFYAGVRDAILHKGPNPITLEQAVQLMELLEAAIQSATELREVSLELEA